MFDLTSSKLLILGILALIVVGPKDLPVLFRTLGKYVAILRRHATEFRSQFDSAMQDNDLSSLKSELEALKREVTATVSAAGRTVEAEIAATKSNLDNSIRSPMPPAGPPPAPLPDPAQGNLPLTVPQAPSPKPGA